MTANRQFRLAARPDGMPGPECWDLVTEDARTPGDGEALVQVLQLSLDPAMRGWMNDARSYVPPVGIGEVFRAIGVGRVLESRSDRVAGGGRGTGRFGGREGA